MAAPLDAAARDAARPPHPAVALRRTVERELAVLRSATRALRNPEETQEALRRGTAATRAAHRALEDWRRARLGGALEEPVDAAQYRFLTSELVAAVGANAAAKEELRGRRRDDGIRRLALVLPDVDAAEAARRFDGGLTATDVLLAEASGEAQSAYAEARERAREVAALAASVQEVAAMFSDLAVLVDGQSEQLSTVGANVETAAARVRQGNADLRAAHALQGSTRAWTCCCCVSLLLACAVTVLGALGGEQLLR
jgi:hypothetical protein